MNLEGRIKEQFPALVVTLLSVLIGLCFGDLVGIARADDAVAARCGNIADMGSDLLDGGMLRVGVGGFLAHGHLAAASANVRRLPGRVSHAPDDLVRQFSCRPEGNLAVVLLCKRLSRGRTGLLAMADSYRDAR